MPHSDDFGIDDDDTAFLAVATQVEASQPGGGFAPSPRPTKKRRIRRRGPAQLDGAGSVDLEWSETDDEGHSPPRSSFFFQVTAAQSQIPAATAQADDDVPDEDDVFDEGNTEDYYLPGELGIEGNSVKNPKCKIHVPENGCKFEDLIFTQTQHGLDENPARFRGAIWKRPQRPQPHVNMGGIANANGFSKGAARAAELGIENYFPAPDTSDTIEDDAALAARLQAEEDLLARQHKSVSRSQAPAGVSQQELATQLDDLPSDAFSSSSPEKSPVKDTLDLSLFSTQPQRQRAAALRGPQTGLKQMTIFGRAATQELTATQAANKRHAWPLTQKEEPPTHHRLETEAMATWVYPTNLGSVRDYQYNIVSRSLFHNTLVALPTGLGKTFIAATIMLNYYRWTTNAQLVFMAPTKPLIAQQMEACYGIVGIPRRDTVLMTGETTPAIRADEWQEKRVFFMTPQTVINDLRTGICDPKRIVLLVVDEAHKATGGYAYTEVIAFLRRFNSSFRVLALTATPGSTVEAVQAVIDNLGIARVELRTEQSIDIRQYTHEKQTETEMFDFSDEQQRIMELISKALRPSLDKLCSQNGYWSRDVMKLTAYGLTQARQKWMGSDAGRKAPMPIKGMMNAIFTVLSSLAHSLGLLKFHGIGPFYSGMLEFQRGVGSGEQKGKTATGIAHSEPFTNMMSTIRSWTNNPDFIGHPKLEYLREVVLNHFLDAGEGRQGSDVPPSATRVMVFASYRDSTDEICRVLKRNEPMIRPHVFVGQAASKGQEGMNQKRQNEVIQDFKTGKYNTLIATSIGEEGLDIGTVDLIVCYDASSSPIRMLQRIGRTGRKRVGRVCLLLMRGKEEEDYAKAQDNYLYIQKTIADEKKYTYRDDQSPRILPKGIKPIADKRPIEIPVENSQPIDLNEKGRRTRGKAKTKRPPKKFHMPDNVRTGFVKASKMDSDSESPGHEEKPSKKSSKKLQSFRLPQMLSNEPITVTPEPVAIPSIANVLLTDEQFVELQNKYATTADTGEDGVIRPPDLFRFPGKLRGLGSTKHVPHGRAARQVETAMKALHNVSDEKIRRFEELFQHADLEDTGIARHRVVNPVVSSGMVAPEVLSKPVSEVVSPKHISAPPAVKNAVGRPKRLPNPPRSLPGLISSGSDTELDLPTHPVSRDPPPAEKPCGRPRKRQSIQRVVSYGSAAGEGVDSSPEPTPADMRIGTQGEDLGSQDTSGEDEEEEPDSDDQAFIARTSDPVEMASSSSQLATPSSGRLLKKSRRQITLSSVEEVDESAREPSMDGTSEPETGNGPVAPGRKRRVVEDSDEDE